METKTAEFQNLNFSVQIHDHHHLASEGILSLQKRFLCNFIITNNHNANVSFASSLLREGSGSSRDVAVEQEVHQHHQHQHQSQHQYVQVP